MFADREKMLVQTKSSHLTTAKLVKCLA